MTEIAAVVLAAGTSSRMGEANKLLCELDGRPMIAAVVEAALASKAAFVTLVTGWDADRVLAALVPFAVQPVHNPDFKGGIASSVAAGVESLAAEVDGVVICLGDMPLVTSAHIDALVEGFDEAGPERHDLAFVPTYRDRWGNPVLWGAGRFDELIKLRGDRGGKILLTQNPGRVREIEVASPGVLRDVDTSADLAEVASCHP